MKPLVRKCAKLSSLAGVPEEYAHADPLVIEDLPPSGTGLTEAEPTLTSSVKALGEVDLWLQPKGLWAKPG